MGPGSGDVYFGSPGMPSLAEMWDPDKVFGDMVNDFGHQFLAVQKQTEAIKHILPLHDFVTTKLSGPGSLSACHRGHPMRDQHLLHLGLNLRILRHLRKVAQPASQGAAKSSKTTPKQP